MTENIYFVPESLTINYRGFVVYCKLKLVPAGSSKETLEVAATPVQKQVNTLGIRLTKQSRIWGYHFDIPWLVALPTVPSTKKKKKSRS